MKRPFGNLWQTARLAMSELNASARRILCGVPMRHEPPTLTLCRLEDRVLMSVSPCADATLNKDGIEAVAVNGAAMNVAAGENSVVPIVESTVDFEIQSVAMPVGSQNEFQRRIELVFVDETVTDYATLLENLRSDASVCFESFVLRSDVDGIRQVTELLGKRRDISAVHFLSHGGNGALRLGATWLNADSVSSYADAFRSWQNSLTHDADLLFYGCNLAGSEVGQGLLAEIQLLTGADVAASEDATGSDLLGGNWDLEARLGDVLTAVAIEARAQQTWMNTLATLAFQNGSGSYGSMIDAALDEATSAVANPSETTLTAVNASSATDGQILLRFQDIFGSGASQIPYGSTITTVTLELFATDAGPGTSSLGLHRVMQDWDENSTWDSWTSGIQTTGTEASTTADATVSTAATGAISFSTAAMANTVQAAANGGSDFGWVITNSSTTPWSIASSEAATVSQRPRLSIVYTAPVTPKQITVTTTDDVIDAPTLTDFGTLTSDVGLDGKISLREALIAANNMAGHNVIFLPSGTFLITNGSGDDNATQGDFDIKDDLLIVGNGSANTIISGNNADRVFDVRDGSDSVFADMTISGGSSNQGGGIKIDNAGVVAVVRSKIQNNTSSGDGGGIYNKTGTLFVVDTEVLNNSATSGKGGGIDNRNIAFFSRTTIATNSAKNGGGINHESAGSVLVLNEVTISGNSASDDGGGLRSKSDSLITHSTIAFNSASNGGGIAASKEGNRQQLRATILSNNTSSTAGTANSDATLTSQGFNLVSDSSANINAATDIIGLSPGLQALASNGGYVRTHAILAGSVALDAGTNLSSAPSDARGVARDTMPDIGAYEATNTGNQKIYWVDDSDNSLVRSNLNGSGKQTLLNGLASPFDVAVDSAAGKVFWTNRDGHLVQVAGMGGESPRTLLTLSGKAFGIDLDTTNRKLFVAEDDPSNVSNRILSANYDGTSATTVVPNAMASTIPYDVQYDVTNNKLYFSSYVDGGVGSTIYRATPDGSAADRTVIYTAAANVAIPSLELDSAGGRLFWLEDGGVGSDLVKRSGLTGTNVTTLSNSPADAQGLALADASILWTNAGTDRISTVSVNGNNATSLLTSLPNPMGIAVTSQAPIDTAVISQSAQNAIIDGAVDSVWGAITSAVSIDEVQPANGTVSSNADLSGTWQAFWTTTGLNVLVNVTDDVLQPKSSTAVYDDDSVEIDLDGDFSHGTSLDGVNDLELNFRLGDPTVNVTAGASAVVNANLIRFAFTTIAGGYRLEAFIPWASIGTTVVPFNSIGMDVSVNDDDNGGARDASITWSDSSDAGSGNPSLFGQVVLGSMGNVTPVASNDSYTLNEDTVFDSNSAWQLSGWSTRKKLSFNNATRTENLADFPVLVKLDSSRIDYSKTQDSGQDLRFVDQDGTVLAYEIQSWDETGTSYVWVRVPVINGSSNTDHIWMYYGNSSATDAQNVNGTWNNSYRTIYHLESTDSVVDANGVVNATSNGNVTTTGVVGNGFVFDGVDDFVNIGDNLNLINNVSGTTLSAWIKADTISGSQTLWAISINSSSATPTSRATLQLADDELNILGRSANSESSQSLTTNSDVIRANQWQLVTGVIDYANDRLTLYVDGQKVAQSTVNFSQTTTANNSSRNSKIGTQDDNSANRFDGLMDELRLSSVVRSADWVSAEYSSMIDGLVTYGSEMSVAGVLDNDTDHEAGGLTATLVTGPTHGNLVLNSNGSFTYTPTANYFGADSFTYVASDGTASSQTQTVSLTVVNVNDPPTIALTNLRGSTAEDTSTATALKFADIEITDDAMGTNTLLLSGADAAKFQLVGTELRLRAGTVIDYETQTSFSVSVSVDDNTVGSSPDDTKSATFAITNVNDNNPVAVAESYTVPENGVLSSANTDLLANDSDADGDSLTATLVGAGPTHGSLSLNGDGTFRYRPVAGFFGTDSFQYVASDGTRQSANTTVTIQVQQITLGTTNEFLVNSTTTDIQSPNLVSRGSHRAVAIAPTGNYVVVWSSLNQDGDGWGVFGQRFDKNGVQLGTEFQINEAMSGDQQYATVAVDKSGRFVVSWTGTDGSGLGIYARVYNSDGTAATSEFVVNTTTSGSQRNSVVDVDMDGNFVVLWQGNGVGDSNGIFGRRFRASGLSIDASEFRLSVDLTNAHLNPALAVNDDGLFVGVWSDNAGVHARLYDASLNAIGGEILVDNAGTATAPAVEMASDGSFTVVWQKNDTLRDIFMRRFDATGTPLTTETLVNQIVSGNQWEPSIAIDATDKVLIAWHGVGEVDADGNGIYVRAYDSTGTALGDEILVNQTTAADQSEVSLAMLEIDAFVAVWGGNGIGDTDGVSARVITNWEPQIHLTNSGITFVEDSPATVIDEQLHLHDTDDANLVGATVQFISGFQADQDVLSFTTVAGVSGSYNSATGLITFTGTASVATYETLLKSLSYRNTSNGPDTTDRVVQISVNDGTAISSESVTIAIQAVNDAPVFVTGSTVTVDENSVIAEVLGASDPDLPADTLTFTIVGGDDASLFTISNSVELTFATSPDFEIPGDFDKDNIYQVEVEVNDGNGGTERQTIAVTVANVNDNPPIAVDDNLVADEDTPLLITDSSLTSNDSDADGDLGSIVIFLQPTNGQLDLDSNTNTLTYTPNQDFHGVDTFSYFLFDGVFASATANVVITVSSINDAPLITSRAFQTVAEDTDLVFSNTNNNAIAIDDVDANGGALVMSLQVSHGTLTLGATANVTITTGADGSSAMTVVGSSADLTAAMEGMIYRSSADYFGTDSLIVSVDDGGQSGIDGAKIATQTVQIAVTPVNDVPQLVASQLVISEGGTVQLTTAEINSLDVDNGTDVFYIISDMTGGQFVGSKLRLNSLFAFSHQALVNGDIRFVHDGNEAAPSFNVTVTDLMSFDGPNAASITFTNVNDIATAANHSYTYVGKEELDNLLTGIVDPEGNTVSVVIGSVSTTDTRMRLSVSDTGQLIYKPGSTFVGTTTIHYQYSDGIDLSNVATITIEVLATNGSGGGNNTGGTGGSGSGGTTTDTGGTKPDTKPDTKPKESPGPPIVPPSSTDSVVSSAPPPSNLTQVTEVKSEEKENAEIAQNADTIDRLNATQVVSRVSRDNVNNRYRANRFDRVDSVDHDEDQASRAAHLASMAALAQKFEFVAQQSSLWTELDEFRKEVGVRVNLNNVVVGSVGGLASGVTIGYVLWALRSGFILSSLLASMPAWTFVDPLAVVPISDGRERHGEGETLEQIVEERKRKLYEEEETT